jgi:hypothetical protein
MFRIKKRFIIRKRFVRHEPRLVNFYLLQFLRIISTASPSQNIEEAVIKKNKSVIIIEILWLLKNLGFCISIFEITFLVKTKYTFNINTITVIAAIWNLFNGIQAKYVVLKSIIVINKRDSEAVNASFVVK